MCRLARLRTKCPLCRLGSRLVRSRPQLLLAECRDPRLAESGATPAAPAQRPLCPSDEGRSAATACLPSAEPESPARDVKHRRARARSANSRGERRAQPAAPTRPEAARRRRGRSLFPSRGTTSNGIDCRPNLFHRGHRGIPWAIGPTRLRALQVGQPMVLMITRVEPGEAAVVSRTDQPPGRESGRIPAATRRKCVKRSIETTRTSCSTRSTPAHG